MFLLFQVSYAKFLDVWMFLSLCFILMALLQVPIVAFFRIKQRKVVFNPKPSLASKTKGNTSDSSNQGGQQKRRNVYETEDNHSLSETENNEQEAIKAKSISEIVNLWSKLLFPLLYVVSMATIYVLYL